MYKAIKDFRDLADNGYSYSVGDTYPREGLEVKESRLAELASKKNRRKEPLIEVVGEKKATKKTAKKAEAKTSAE